MRKLIIILIMCVMLFSFVGCKTGQVYRAPGQLMAVGRTVVDNEVTLDTDVDPSLDANEIIIIAESLPDGVIFVSANPPVDISSDQVVVWLFAKNPPQTLGSMPIDKGIPSIITYTTTGTAVAGSFRGKWGLKLANVEGLIVSGQPCTPDCTGKVCGDDGCGGTCGSCGVGESCQNGQCVPGGSPYDFNTDGLVDGSDIMYVIINWGQTICNNAVCDGASIMGVIINWSR